MKKNTIPGLRVSANPITPKSTSNPADMGTISDAFRRDYPKEALAMERLQDAIQNILRFLRQSPPQVTRIEVDDPNTGLPVAVLGNYVPPQTGSPILNFFSSITLLDNSDPSIASIITLNNGALVITRGSVDTAVSVEVTGVGGSVTMQSQAAGPTLGVQGGGGSVFLSPGQASVNGLPGASGTFLNSVTVQGGIVVGGT